MKNKYLLLLLLMVAVPVMAQHSGMHKNTKDSTGKLVAAYMDSLNLYKQKLDSLTLAAEELQHTSDDGRYYRLFAPFTFYHSAADRQLRLNSPLKGKDEVADAVDAAMMYMYLHRPDLVRNSETKLLKSGKLREDISKPIKQRVDFVEHAPSVTEEPIVTSDYPDLVITRPNFWTFAGDYNLQVIQNYVSDNWYKGGESNYSIVGGVVLQANYNNKQKLKWENKLEMKLGFQTSRDDTIHKAKTNNDLLRYTGKLGIQAHKNWYYTLQLLAYTQFTQGLKSNDKYVYSDFMSPFNLNLGLGLDYSVDALNHKLTGSVNLSFLSFNYKRVDRQYLATRYGIGENHHSTEDFGSQLTADLTWVLMDNIKWKTRLYGYTTYKKTLLEWENTFTFTFNKFISSTLFVFPRFDDGGNYDDKLGYWQFKEYCAMGFTYSF